MRRTTIILCSLPLITTMAGCRLVGPPADVEHVGTYVRAPEPVAAVDLIHEPVEWERQPYETIARISTNVRARDFPTMAEAEAEGYERLRFHAARAGALAVINIEQQVTLDGRVVDVDAYEPRAAVENYIIHMRGTAVRFRERQPRP